MAEPVWVREDVALAIHQRQIAEHGGADGVRDLGLLQSALARPKSLLSYSDPDPDLARLAASYAHAIAKNHPFVDGNKRVAWIVCRTFLRLNGVDINASQEQKYLAFIQLAASELSEIDLANWLRERIAMRQESDQ